MNDTTTPQRIQVRPHFFCDGHYTVLSSSSLANRPLNPEELAETLSEGAVEEIRPLLEAGICIPLEFPGDCVLNNPQVVIGELTEQESQEWVGRISGKLNIPCGKLLFVAGGGDPYDWENALAAEPDDDSCFAIVTVPPGEYLVEIFAYLNSMNAAYSYLKDLGDIALWFEQTRAGQEMPEFVKLLSQDQAYLLEENYVGYLVRLSLQNSDSPLPEFKQGWLSEFSFRRLDKCPLGIRYTTAKNPC